MANRRIEVDIVANDNASSVFHNIRSNASSMSSTLMSALGGTANAVGTLDSALRNYNASMYRFNRVVGDVVRTAGDSIYNFTKDAINNFSALEQQHAKTMGAMATEYGKTTEAQQKFLEDSAKLKQQALTLGTVGPNGTGSLNTVYDVSYAQTALVKSGMSADDILKSDAVESILKFAGGNDLDIDTATTFAVNLATVFDKPVEQWGEMLDMVTKAADISVIDVEDIMDSLTYTGGIASGLGRDLEEVLGIISVMGQAGLRGRVAGTGLQAFFTRILSAGELGDTAIGNAPSEYVGNMYNAFVAEAVNPDGSFKDMDDVASLLDTAMSELNDQEQAWFAKKLFGLYQMKAAYAITGAVEGDENLITDFIDQIANESSGTNDIKYQLMQASQYGKLESLKNAWEGIKTDVGDRLSPVVTTIADELFAFLNDPQNYEFDWDNLRTAISESGDLLSEKYGEEIGKAIEGLGNLGIDSAIIAEALIPQAGGIISAIGKLAEGDITGALEEFAKGIEDTNANIDGLPEDLQGTATAASNVITAFTTLASINLGTQILQIITSAFNMFVAKPISWVTGKVSSGSTSVSSANSTVNANYVGVNTSNTSVQTGTATVNIGSIPVMNVSATVVNVFGGSSGLNPGSGGNMLPSGGTPLLPSGGGGLGGFLPSVAGGALGTGAAIAGSKYLPGLKGLLGSGTTSQGLLGSGMGTTGKVIDLYKFGGTYMSASDIVRKLTSTAGKGLTLAAILGFAKMSASPGLFDSEDSRVQDGNDWLDRYVAEGNTDYYSISGNARVGDYFKYGLGIEDYRNDNKNGGPATDYVRAEMEGRTAARNEMMAFYTSGEGATLLNDLFTTQIEENGKITEEFLTAVTRWTKDGYTYTGSNDDIKSILDFMYSNFDNDYKDSWTYAGRFNDAAVNDFLKDNPTLNSFDTIQQSIDGITSATSSAISDIGSAINRIQSPNVNVNVKVNVDRSGNTTTTTDITGASRDIARRASQYGQTNMIN